MAPPTAWDGIYGDVVRGTALTCIIFSASLYMPVVGFLFALFLPLPVLFYRTKLGRTGGAVIPAASILCLGIFIGRLNFDVVFFTALIFLGYVLSELMERNISVEKTVLYAAAAVIGAALAAAALAGAASQTGVGELASAYIEKSLRQSLILYENMGVPEETIRMITDSFDRIHYVLVRIIPAAAVSATLFVTWSALLLSRPMLKSRNLDYPAFGPLNVWKSPDGLVWAVIACGGMLLTPADAIRLTGLNGLIILMTVYFFQGVAIISYYFEKKQFPVFLRCSLYALIAIWQLALLAVIALGFFDIWLDFRKLEKNGLEHENGG